MPSSNFPQQKKNLISAQLLKKEPCPLKAKLEKSPSKITTVSKTNPRNEVKIKLNNNTHVTTSDY